MNRSANILGVKNFWLLFVALVIPLQAALAMSASYCELELMPKDHAGHHLHSDQDDNTSSKSGVGSFSRDIAVEGTSDAMSQDAANSHHCGTCHFGCSPVATIDSLGIKLPSVVSSMDFGELKLFVSSPPLDLPERPKWANLA